MEFQNKKSIGTVLVILGVVLSFYFAVKGIEALSSKNFASSGVDSTITLSGHGEIKASPDIASFYFSITKEAKTVKEAQDMVAEIEGKVLASLKDNKIEDKDIKTENASFYPKYEYKYDSASLTPCTQYGCPPRTGKSVITGYEATESITVKVRDLDSVGKVMQDLGAVGVSNLNGPNFSIDDEDGLKAEARKKAIDDAKEKAKVLAGDLGVRLGKVVNFNESGNYYPVYAKGAMAMDSMMTESAPAPATLPQGENTISSDVTITYEIK